jgi:sugar lactone lactonase YvrE
VHQFSVDSDGNLYAAETFGGRTQKFRPKPGADSSQLIGVPVPLMAKATK